MMQRLIGLLRPIGLALALLVALLTAGEAIAQAGAGEGVPQPTLRRGSPIWLGYAVMFGLVAAVMLVSLMPSKRGHQD